MRLLVRPLLHASLVVAACARASAPPPSPPATAASGTPLPGPLPPHANAEQLGTWIDAYVSAFGARWGEAYAAQGYLVIAEDGKILFEKAYGEADRARGRVAGLDTRFRIGSLTKQFTSAAILQLAEQGRLRLDDPIRKYLPDYPAAGDAITIHHLLTHTSGIPNYTDDEALMQRRERPMTQAELIASFKDKPLEFEPGSEFEYSNSGYFLLGVIIERVSGERYEDYLQANVLRPAGMTRTSTVDAPDADDTAIGYVASPDETLTRAQPIDMSIPFAAGALRSTARDLLAWDRALAGDTILDETWKERMFTPFKDGYAYGWFVGDEQGKRVVSHAAGIDGFTGYIARVPEAGLVVIALSNNEDFPAARIGRPALSMVLSGEPIPPVEERSVLALDEAVTNGLIGEYVLAPESRKELEAAIPAANLQAIASVAFSTEGGRLFFKAAGQERRELFQGEGGVLFTKTSGVEITADPGDRPNAPAKGVTVAQGELRIRYARGSVGAKKSAAPKRRGDRRAPARG
ncbi:serine hydrolase domain-containing protein [Nannocystis radixulma]|uniref:Serine hydrolase n=1 Tax=Nannocystis radixulma TaxID=2995305 RepID=A0ABT5BK42_9BACT|nr:serine hydrolase domain-containing protein [Nannocystis radixulma]MDC0674522.1 serine hydrolase [Nannocystis radixulma]